MKSCLFTILCVLATCYSVASPANGQGKCPKAMEYLGPKLEDLPPPFKTPEETQLYYIVTDKIMMGDRQEERKIIDEIQSFLKSKQMSHLHAQVSSRGMANEEPGLIMWADPESAKIIRDHFATADWYWRGIFHKHVEKIRPELQSELERRKKLVQEVAQKILHLLADDKTPAPLSQLPALINQTLEEYKAGNPFIKGINLAHYNSTENAEYLYSQRRFAAFESFSKVIVGLSEEGLLQYSLSSSQYYMALRLLTKLSDRVKGDHLRSEIEEQMQKAKVMTEDEVAFRARSEAVSKVFYGSLDGIRWAEGDPLIEEVGYGLLNKIVENFKLSEMMLDSHTAQVFRNATAQSAFNRKKDGMEGPVPHLGPQRVKFLEWVLRERHLDERARLAAQNLLRRGGMTNLLGKKEVEALYLQFAARVTTQPKAHGLYEFGYFINETYNMQSEVSEYVVLADGEAKHLQIQPVDWKQPEKASERLTALLISRIK